jgi:hypothetical protein
MSALAEKECVPCKGGTPALKGAELQRFAEQLHGDWNVVDEHHLEREFRNWNGTMSSQMSGSGVCQGRTR